MRREHPDHHPAAHDALERIASDMAGTLEGGLARTPGPAQAETRRPSRTLSRHGGALMLHVAIAGAEDLNLEHLAMDVNGTLSDRGRLIDGVADRLSRPGDHLALRVLAPRRRKK